jgi:hypothetical protein
MHHARPWRRFADYPALRLGLEVFKTAQRLTHSQRKKAYFALS